MAGKASPPKMAQEEGAPEMAGSSGLPCAGCDSLFAKVCLPLQAKIGRWGEGTSSTSPLVVSVTHKKQKGVTQDDKQKASAGTAWLVWLCFRACRAQRWAL